MNRNRAIAVFLGKTYISGMGDRSTENALCC